MTHDNRRRIRGGDSARLDAFLSAVRHRAPYAHTLRVLPPPPPPDNTTAVTLLSSSRAPAGTAGVYDGRKGLAEHTMAVVSGGLARPLARP